MTTIELTLLALVALFGAGICSCLLVADPRRMIRIPVIVTALSAVAVAHIFYWCQGAPGARVFVFARQFLIDPLTLFHLFLVTGIFFAASLYCVGYFARQIAQQTITTGYVRRFCMLWMGFHLVLIVVLLSNNIGILWVALEATTLISAFLILSDNNSLSIEAMWKYLLICSVGIVFAFFGTILVIAASRGHTGAESLCLWTDLRDHAAFLDPNIMLLAFIFILVGFGTKAGLAPMHTWLPDAHSQAPTPVSAVFSGVMLNCALYCIMRYLPLAEAALKNSGEAHQLVLIFGVLSLIIAAVYIPVQHDIKRLLAYHSVEHMGIIAVGLGLGGLGVFACLLHTLNHSLSKTLAFFSAGQLGQQYGTRDMREIRGAIGCSPLWGRGFFIAIMVLIGVAPFSIFMSEFLILTAAFEKKQFIVVGLFLFSALTVFISALKHAMDVSLGKPKETALPEKAGSSRLPDLLTVVVIAGALLLLGLYIPGPLFRFLTSAAAVIGGSGY